MTVKVEPQFPYISPEPTHNKRVASASNFANPMITGANHLAGYRLGTMIHSAFRHVRLYGSGFSSSVSNTARFYTYRHPNCTHLAAMFTLTDQTATASEVVIKAGNGAPTYYYVRQGLTGYILTPYLIPWGVSDTGDQEVTYYTTNCKLGGIMIFNAHRLDMNFTNDDCVEEVDQTYPRAGMSPARYIIDGTTNSTIQDIVSTITFAKDNWKPQFLSYSFPGQDHTFNTSTWQSYRHSGHSSDCTWRHIAKQYRNYDATRTYRVYVQTYIQNPSGNTYDWRFRASATGHTASQTGLSNTSWAWSNAAVLLNAGSEEEFQFQMRCTSATPTLHFRFLSVYED